MCDFAVVKAAVMLTLFPVVDIDECSEGISGCSQNCENTVGSFTCSCRNGYRNSEQDQRICIGMECGIKNQACNLSEVLINVC